MLPYLVALLIIVGIYALLTISLDLQYGFTGLVNFGIVAFFAIGAYCSALVIRGKRITRKTLEPKLATFSATYLLAPFTMETTTISVETDRMMPSRVKNDRSLCARSVSRAIMAGSFRDTPLRVVLVVGIDLPVIRGVHFSLLRLHKGDDNYRK